MGAKVKNPSQSIYSPNDLPERLSEKIGFPDAGFASYLGCWIWRGSILSGYNGGYGRVYCPHVKQTISSHVAVWREIIGPIPKGYQLDHLCRVRSCCNPAHLEAITAKENSQRRVLSTTFPQVGDNPVDFLVVDIPILDSHVAIW